MTISVVRVRDIPVVLIAFVIEFFIFMWPIFALWKATGGISQGLVFVWFFGSLILSLFVAKRIWIALASRKAR